MSLKTLMLIKAAVCAVLGAIILIVPTFLYSLFGAELSDGGIFAAREYGAALIGNMLVTWIARSAVESTARRAIIIGLCVYDAVGFVVTLIATLTGVLNPLGWLVVALYLFLALAFGYFWWRSPKP
jgi:hypothetical protein